jgi:hypothetical protein
MPIPWASAGLTDIVPASCGATTCYVAEAHVRLLNNLSVGTHALTAVYSGDALFAPATSAPFTITVTPIVHRIPTVVTGIPATFIDTQPITVAAAITIDPADLPAIIAGEPGGHVDFLENGVMIPWASAGLTDIVPASCGPTACYVAEAHVRLASPLSVGTHTLTAVYSGDFMVAPGNSAPFTITVEPLAMNAVVAKDLDVSAIPALDATHLAWLCVLVLLLGLGATRRRSARR